MTGTYVFDAYGTLFDVHSAVARHRARLGPAADRLSQTWRLKQLEYTWVRTMSGAYRDFAVLTEEALDYAAALCGGMNADLRRDLLAAYEELDAYPDVVATLTRLRENGARLAILSNGTPRMLSRAVEAAGLESLFEQVLSVDALELFKTAPQAYALIEATMGVRPDDVSFQSSNRWDIAGAARFGLRTVWINRQGLPNEYSDMPPMRVLPSLAGLMEPAA